MKKKLDRDSPRLRKLVLQHEAIAVLAKPTLDIVHGGTSSTFTRFCVPDSDTGCLP